MKSWLKNNDKEMCSAHTGKKSIVAELFLELKKKLKCMTSKSKCVYIGKFEDIVNKHNKAYQSTIKMKCIDVNFSTYSTTLKKN